MSVARAEDAPATPSGACMRDVPPQLLVRHVAAIDAARLVEHLKHPRPTPRGGSVADVSEAGTKQTSAAPRGSGVSNMTPQLLVRHVAAIDAARLVEHLK